MEQFFTSDTHFFHARLLEKGRPFANVEDMNETMIQNWNSRVSANDLVWHLGDVSFGKSEPTREILNRLNGRKILVRGNHDPEGNSSCIKRGFTAVVNQIVVSILGRPFLMSHYPYRQGQILRHVEKHGEAFTDKVGDLPLLCGHVHDAWKKHTNQLNVGVDVWDFTPVSEVQIADAMKEFFQ